MNKQVSSLAAASLMFLLFLVLGLNNYRKDPGDHISLLCIGVFAVLIVVSTAGIIWKWKRR